MNEGFTESNQEYQNQHKSGRERFLHGLESQTLTEFDLIFSFASLTAKIVIMSCLRVRFPSLTMSAKNIEWLMIKKTGDE